jgi:hypothetical protein
MDANFALKRQCAIAALYIRGYFDAYVYKYEDGRWSFTSDGKEYWLWDDENGVRIELATQQAGGLPLDV